MPRLRLGFANRTLGYHGMGVDWPCHSLECTQRAKSHIFPAFVPGERM